MAHPRFKLLGKGSVTAGDTHVRAGHTIGKKAFEALPERQQQYFEKVEPEQTEGDAGDGPARAKLTASKGASTLAEKHDLDLRALVEAGDLDPSGEADEGEQRVVHSDVQGYLDEQEEA